MDRVLFSSSRHDWETPPELFAELDAEFGFTLDPCCTEATAKCAKHYTADDDGLSKSWRGERVFCNPPYGRAIGSWVEKCATEDALCVMLIPARTDTRYFHEHIYRKPGVEIRFLRGRVRFLQNGERQAGAPFPSMVVVFRNDR